MSAIAKSASGKSEDLSYGVVKKTLDSLKEKNVISVVGDTNREGTLYKYQFLMKLKDVRHCWRGYHLFKLKVSMFIKSWIFITSKRIVIKFLKGMDTNVIIVKSN